MPRYPTQSDLPPLAKLLPNFTALEPGRAKLRQVADWLRPAIAAHRTTRNLLFYSTRDLASFFKVSQNTAIRAVKLLEVDGLLRRMRGNQILFLGTKVITNSRIRAVAGLLLWNFAHRFSLTHNALIQCLAEELWPHNIALELIPHYDKGDIGPDLNERLKKHSLDFTIWPFPFSHHKDHFLHLQDRGIRSLIIGVNGVSSSFEPHIVVDFIPTYEKLLRYWKKEQDIRRVIVIHPREFPPRKRIGIFAKMATDMGFDCTIETNSYTLLKELLAREKQRIGIALLDEHSSAEFVFYDPPSFVEIARRHRILFGNDHINVPFVPDGELWMDSIFIPMVHVKSEFRKPLAPAIAKTLVQWCSGDFSSPPLKVQTLLWTNRELWRYI